jgi:hypothetical protein
MRDVFSPKRRRLIDQTAKTEEIGDYGQPPSHPPTIPVWLAEADAVDDGGGSSAGCGRNIWRRGLDSCLLDTCRCTTRKWRIKA